MSIFKKRPESRPTEITLSYEAFNQLMIITNILTLRVAGIERFMGMSETDFDKVIQYMEDEGIISINEREQVKH